MTEPPAPPPPAAAVNHIAVTRSLADIRGLVLFASCTCGWRGPNHCANGATLTTAEASQRAAADADEHLRKVAPPAPADPCMA
jgi:hypothetical protein